MEKTLVARWESRGKKNWVELFKDIHGYTYRSSNGGGVMGRIPFAQAMEQAKRHADNLGVQMARTLPHPGQRPPWRGSNPSGWQSAGWKRLKALQDAVVRELSDSLIVISSGASLDRAFKKSDKALQSEDVVKMAEAEQALRTAAINAELDLRYQNPGIHLAPWEPGSEFASRFRPGDRFTILVHAGGIGRNMEWARRSGRAIMPMKADLDGVVRGWVLNMGGPHGTPGLARFENTVFVTRRGEGRIYQNGYVARSGRPADPDDPRNANPGAGLYFCPDCQKWVAGETKPSGSPMWDPKAVYCPACGQTVGRTDAPSDFHALRSGNPSPFPRTMAAFRKAGLKPRLVKGLNEEPWGIAGPIFEGSPIEVIATSADSNTLPTSDGGPWKLKIVSIPGLVAPMNTTDPVAPPSMSRDIERLLSYVPQGIMRRCAYCGYHYPVLPQGIGEIEHAKECRKKHPRDLERRGNPSSWAAEVVADSTGKFCGNALRFATKEEAESYARNLAMRWTAVSDWRVVESSDPVTEGRRNNPLACSKCSPVHEQEPAVSPLFDCGCDCHYSGVKCPRCGSDTVREVGPVSAAWAHYECDFCKHNGQGYLFKKAKRAANPLSPDGTKVEWENLLSPTDKTVVDRAKVDAMLDAFDAVLRRNGADLVRRTYNNFYDLAEVRLPAISGGSVFEPVGAPQVQDPRGYEAFLKRYEAVDRAMYDLLAIPSPFYQEVFQAVKRIFPTNHRARGHAHAYLTRRLKERGKIITGD